MRLEKIKLSGFKSFVDPTSIAIPGRLIGVVGPNGCGKSNIIDAVRWVMGESSAKHLRGSAMSDVIFNGSSSRKPVGLATIELLFDNSEGKLGGEYARYSQISVKRQVTRDGQSQYFLNGTRCRRRDIMDVFLGTGLGPRSYAIIEQGTVSRFIEAKPEELRLFVEEAAGLSKYKERRHETELKLQHTRANLERVEDLRGELQNQVNRLARQAKKAEKYRALEQTITQCHKELLAIQWRDAHAQYDRHQKQLNLLEQQLTERSAELLEAETSLEQAQQKNQDLERQLQRRQAKLYELNAEISRCNQALKHARQTQEERQRTLQSWRDELQRAMAAHQQDQEQITRLDDQKQKLEQELTQVREEHHQASISQQKSEAHWQQKRRDFERCRDQVRNLKEKINLREVEIRHRLQRKEDLQGRLRQLKSQQERLTDNKDDHAEIIHLQDQFEEVTELHHQQREKIDALTGQIRQLQSQRQDLQQTLHELESEINQSNGRITALETLQSHALGKDRQVLQKWLVTHGLQHVPRLAEIMAVEKGWEKAVETALGSWLEALCLDELKIHTVAETADTLTDENISFLETSGASPSPEGSLAEKISSRWNSVTLLGGHRCAGSLQEALAKRSDLAGYECWITPDGDRIGPNWLQLNRHEDTSLGVLERENELRMLRGELETLKRHKERLFKQQEQLVSQLHEAENQLDQLRSQERETSTRQTRLQAELQGAQRRLEETRRQLEHLSHEHNEVSQSLRQTDNDLAACQRQLEQDRSELGNQEQALQNLETVLAQSRSASEQASTAVRTVMENKARLESALEHAHSSLKILQKQLERAQGQCQDLQRRLAQAENEQAQGEQPLNQITEQLELLRRQHPSLEKSVANLRHELKQAESTWRQLRSLHAQRESLKDRARENLEAARLKAEAARVRLQTVQEQVESADFLPDRILADLDGEATACEWQQRLDQLQLDKARLGDVNLAAIEEHRLHSERLRFLDKQYDDLTTSLDLLDKAIRTIDRETRSRFRETFKIVDGHFRNRFPALFGGGEASLEMTCDDPLEAGIRIMARPPGKRNSSIHLLSGGEKALTAVALVFSFFELNPAPFCMLDEVDAPLDEANVGRFCALLQSMSERVQFIFVTHNKTTMEIADQLIGVTMREPGVSRIVSVDLERAAEMAAA